MLAELPGHVGKLLPGPWAAGWEVGATIGVVDFRAATPG